MWVDIFQGILLSNLLKLHHAVCVVCHAYACLSALAGFPYYFAGVVALEMGSAATSLHALWPKRFRGLLLNGTMTVSNALATYTTYHWHFSLVETTPVGAWLGSIVSMVLIVVRQVELRQCP